MVIDTSALYAIIAGEPERPAFIQAIASDPMRLISSFTLFECLVVTHAKLKSEGVARLQALIERADAEIVPLDGEQIGAAYTAWARFGKGRSPAALNLGDCCSYALAITRSQRLLYKGNDFVMTDIEPAI